MSDVPNVVRRPDEQRGTRLVRWETVDNNPSLIGRATIQFAGGWTVASIPIFRRNDNALSCGAPSVPLLDAAGQVQRDPDGKKRYLPVITFADRDARARRDRAVLTALADANIGGAAS